MRPPLAIWSWAKVDQDVSADALAEARHTVLKNFSTDASPLWSLTKRVPSEIGDTSCLKEFQSSNFRDLVERTRENINGLNSPPPQKTERLNMNEIIPLPHLIIGEEGISAKVNISRILEHTIASSLTPNVDKILNNPHGRLTWIVPVTRKLPCPKRITYAVMVIGEESNMGHTRASLTHGTPDLITWTPQDLLIFWLWLRDTLTQGVFGCLTLSVTSMKLPRSAEEVEEDRNITGDRQRTSRRIHYIAIHHGATHSLRLRTYLGHFDPERISRLLLPESKEVLTANSPEAPHKRAVLKNAKFLLVDSEQRGVLIS
ncbi:hypothetical protein FRB94_005849 [Tulasnella sp. JGI-2019a]|nr:hypothetical protein FRB93_011466 [Tulasnella sp. JGI-2019a]KAG9012532.1 hypothetical protein FRB94_005849 [Tulasnella sp. JGI-2019a]KAG9036582.1 hypothetical protein FRB95_008416 [Tulasnella sp. JGI-2019a]